MSMEEDRVVAELDVYSCRTLWGQTTKLCLLQYPLRPLWRPYELDDTSTMRVKTKAGRVAMTVPLDTQGDNYNEDADDALKLKHFTLQSRPAQLSTTHALGVIRGGKFLLMPIDEAHQMRPHMAHLDEAAVKEAAPAVKHEAPTDELALLTVQVQRRETERQAQMRLKSHAYISKLEADEEWVDIKFRDLSTDDNVWRKLEGAPEEELPMELTAAEYLTALLPTSIASQQPEDDEKLVAAHRSAGEAFSSAHIEPGMKDKAGEKIASAAGALQGEPDDTEPAEDIPELAAEELKEFKKALATMYRHGPVVSLTSIRGWLTEVKTHKVLDRLGKASDPVLHDAVNQTGLSTRLQNLYVHTATDNADVTKFREVALALLAKKGSMKKAEVVQACQVVKLEMSDAQYTKQLKELCQSRGAQWFLRESSRA